MRNVVLEGHVTWTEGDRWEGRGEGWEEGESVYRLPGARVDKHSHHEIKKGDFQVSKRVNSICRQKGKRKEKGGAIKKGLSRVWWTRTFNEHLY
jgi:hypothetical protein